MEYHIIKAVHYGSPELKAELRHWIGGRGLYATDAFKESMEKAKNIIINEISDDNFVIKADEAGAYLVLKAMH